MTLRARLGLAAVALAVAIIIGFGAVAYSFFTRQQEEQLRIILAQDLERVTTLLDRPTLGSTFPQSGTSSVVLQLVTPGGQVALQWGDEELLPAVDQPTTVLRAGRSLLVTTGGWPETNGTIRLAHDISAALAVRRDLVRSLVGAAIAVTLVAAAAALTGARRMLSPLARVAQQARLVDPASPEGVEYGGPRDEIGDLVAALNTALEAIRQRQEAERGFLLEVAHELAAPLTLVNYHLGAVRRDHPEDARVRAAADGTRELLRTSQDLLVLARGELERPLELRVVDLREIVQRVADEYPGINVDAAERLEVVGDPERLMQVVRNLVRNALSAVGRPDGVKVTLLNDGDQAVLQVCDEGPGMSDEIAARIFDRGFSSGGGVGVGLTVCRRLVEQHHGEIRLRSTVGQGSCFEVRLLSLAARLKAPSADGVEVEPVRPS
ncbi:MAG TPA: HAMP domain-containing sensor histidine kinase [Trueperaceae bacterium]|nr:HAMP domain-containing sensor histidine kinase [Trueperaceae bacterium]